VLLALLWIWVVAVAVVIDLFWNVDEFDGIRPRSSLYRGMRVAGHKLVGVPVEEGVDAQMRRGLLLRYVTTPQEMRAVVTFCRHAKPADASRLRKVALASTDPLVAGNAIRALGRLKMVAGDESILTLLADERPRVRQEVIVALGKSGWRGSVQRLAPLVRDSDQAVRLLAIQAIRELGGNEADALLSEVRSRAAATDAERAFVRSAPR
jgi:hypothetical protein